MNNDLSLTISFFIPENEKESEIKTRISETIDQLKDEKFDQMNFLRLKNLEESI